MSYFVVLRDNREQKGWDFDSYRVDVSDETLRTGDYTLEAFCDYDAEHDTYLPRRAIERKAPNDFLSSITQHRGRFRDEIERADHWDVPLEVIIEEPLRKFMDGTGVIRFRDIEPSHVSGTTEAWEDTFNVEFCFAETEAQAEQMAFDTLLAWHLGHGESD